MLGLLCVLAAYEIVTYSAWKQNFLLGAVAEDTHAPVLMFLPRWAKDGREFVLVVRISCSLFYWISNVGLTRVNTTKANKMSDMAMPEKIMKLYANRFNVPGVHHTRNVIAAMMVKKWKGRTCSGTSTGTVDGISKYSRTTDENCARGVAGEYIQTLETLLDNVVTLMPPYFLTLSPRE